MVSAAPGVKFTPGAFTVTPPGSESGGECKDGELPAERGIIGKGLIPADGAKALVLIGQARGKPDAGPAANA